MKLCLQRWNEGQFKQKSLLKDTNGMVLLFKKCVQGFENTSNHMRHREYNYKWQTGDIASQRCFTIVIGSETSK